MKFMDLLFKRYASPLTLISGYLASNSFSSFVINLIELINEEENENKLWELYLFSQSFTEKSFNDFKKEFEKPVETEVNRSDLEATIRDSFNILNEFNPS